jgi:hypothetical protein
MERETRTSVERVELHSRKHSDSAGRHDVQAPLLMRKTTARYYAASGIVLPPLSVPTVLSSARAQTPHGPRGIIPL